MRGKVSSDDGQASGLGGEGLRKMIGGKINKNCHREEEEEE